MKKLGLAALTVLMASFLSCAALYALPEGEQVENGSATFDKPTATTLNITASDKAVINFNSFNIAYNEVVTFIQPSSDASVLSRVTGSQMSQIYGALNANGTLFLVNPNGIYFAPTAQVNVNNLIASTLDISTNNFINGNYILERNVNSEFAYILNEGRITGSNIALIASAVSNGDTGVLVAKVGTVNLASGDKVTVSFDRRGFLQVEINEKTTGKVLDMNGNDVKDAVKNSGTIEATQVMMSAKTANDIFENAINNTGVVKATGMVEVDGVIKIVSNGNINANLAGSTANIEVNRLDQDISISACTRVDDLITIEGNGLKVTYMVTSDFTLKTENAIDTTPGAILQGNSITLIANRFGTTVTPLNIDSPNIHIQRTIGNIDILESVGIGTSVQITGPPDGFGAIIYPKEANLTLTAENIELKGEDPAYLYGNITFSNLKCTVPDKYIYFEAGKTFTILGELLLKGAYARYVRVVSTVAGENWYIDPRGDRDLTYLWVEDSYNLDPLKIAMTESTNRTNNYNWDATATWIGAAAGLWSNVANWDGLGGAATPGAGDDVVFNATANTTSSVDVGFTSAIGSLSLNSGCTSTVTVANSLATTTASSGTGNVTLNAGILTLATGKTLTVAGTLTVSGGTLTATNGNIDVEGDVIISSGTLTAPTTGRTFTVAGNWTRLGGTFTYNTGTVTLDGTNQTFTGSTSFYALTKTVSSADILTFTNGTTQTITNSLILRGAASNLLTLQSDAAATFLLRVIGASTIDYVSVSYCNSSTGYQIIAFNSTNVLNNTYWLFPVPNGTPRYWIATSTANWNDTNNWSTTSGGTGGASVPGATETAIFDYAKSGNCTVNAVISIQDLYLAGYAGIFTQATGYAITLAGDYYQSSGAFTVSDHVVPANLPAFTIGATKTFAISGGTFNRYIGTGAVATPYEIRDVYDLQAMRCSRASYYKLANDIAAAGTANWNSGSGFEPIGRTWSTSSTTWAFSGNFDGNSKTISDLFINMPAVDGIGLFGSVFTTGSRTIKDVGLVNVNITGNGSVGGLIGSAIHLIDVTNCYVTGSVTGNSSYTGGLIGQIYVQSSTAIINISNSYATANVTGTSYVGGLVGRALDYYTNSSIKGIFITDCYATGNVIGSSTYVGGLIGRTYGHGSASMPIINVTSSYATGNVSGVTYVGGLIGENYAYSNLATIVVDKCYATGTVTATGNNAGGLIGRSAMSVANTQTITITDSYATGSVTGVSYVGGLVGYQLGVSSNSNLDILNCYSTGVVTGTTNKGGFIGYDTYGDYSEGDSYWNSTNNPTLNGIGNKASPATVHSATTAEMKLQATYNGWDFATPIWNIDTSPATYPYLQDQVWTWDAGGDGITWTDTANWDKAYGYPSTATNRAVINIGSAAITTPASSALTLGVLTLASGFSGSLTLGNTLTLSSSSRPDFGYLTVGAGTLAIADKDLAATGTMVLSGGAITGTTGILTCSTGYDVRNGSISAILAGNVGVTKTTADTVILSGANTYTGTTTVSAGTLTAGAPNVFGGASSTSALTITGGILDMAGFSQALGSLTGEGGTITSSSAGTVILTIGYDNTSPAVYNGIIENGSGTVSLTKAGDGTLTLGGDNTYSGDTTLNAGTLNINSATAIGAGTFTINGGTINNTYGSAITLSNNNLQTWGGDFTFTGTGDLNLGAGAVTLSADRTVTVSAGILTVGGVISGAGFGVTKAGSGTLTLTAANTYSDATTISSGTLTFSGTGTALNCTSFTIQGGGALTLDNSATNVASRIADAVSITMKGGSFNFIGNDSAASSETVGALNLSFGDNTVSATSGAGGATTLTFASISRSSGATMLFRGTNLGSNPGAGNTNIMFTDPAGLNLTGGGGAAGSTTISIVPYAIGDISATGSGIGFVTYNVDTNGNTNGIRPLDLTTEYTTSTDDGSTQNVRLTASASPDANRTWNSLLISGNGVIYTIGATGTKTLTIATGAICSAGTNTNTIAGAANYTLTAPASPNNEFKLFTIKDLKITAPITDTNTPGVTKASAGALNLSASNTHSGGTTLNAGTLYIDSATLLGTGTFTISGGTIDNTSAGSLTLSNNNAQTWNGSFVFTGTDNLNMGTGAVTLESNATLTVNGTNTLRVDGVIGGAYSLAKAGTGALTLSGTNTFGGAGKNFTLTAGTFNINNASAIGDAGTTFIINGGTIVNETDGALTINYAQVWGGSFAIALEVLKQWYAPLNFGTGAVTMTSDVTITTNANTHLLVGGVISGNYNLTKTGGMTGMLTLSGANTFGGSGKSFTFGTGSNAGCLYLNNASALGSVNNTFVLNAGGGYSYIGNTSGAPVTLNNYAMTWSGSYIYFYGPYDLNLGAGNVTMTTNVTLSSYTPTPGNIRIPPEFASLVITTPVNLTVGGVISGAYNLILGGYSNGAITLSGANTFGGVSKTVTFNGGILNINNAQALGNSSNTFVIGISGNLWWLDNTSGNAITLNNYAQTWSSNFTFIGTNNLNLGTGAVTMGASRTVTVNGGTLTVGGIISGASMSLTKAGVGTLALTGVSTFNGGVVVNGGKLLLDLSTNTTGVVAAANILTMGGGTLEVKGKNTGTSGQILGNVTINAGASSIILNPNGGTSTILNLGTITATTAGGSLLVGKASGAGTGTITITTTSNKDAAGIYGGRVIYTSDGGATCDWATTASGSSPYTLSAYAGYTTLPTSGGSSGVNYIATSNTTLTGSFTVNTLKIATGVTVALDSYALTVNSGGLLVVGSTAVIISGSAVPGLIGGTNGIGGYDLVVGNYNTGAGNGLTISAIIGNNGANATALTAFGTGTTIISSASNSYTGLTMVGTGTLQAGANNVFGGASSTSALTINIGATLDMNGYNQAFGSLTGSGGTITSSRAGAVTLTIGYNNTSPAVYNGIIQNGLGTVSLTKVGSGTLTLGGNNTYSGNTTLDGTGTLAINLNTSLGTGTFIQNTGTTFTNNISTNSMISVIPNNAQWNGSITINNGPYFSDNVAMGSNVTIAGNSTFGVVGVLSGAYNLAYSNVRLRLFGANTFGGVGNTITQGASGFIYLFNDSALGDVNNTVVWNAGSFFETNSSFLRTVTLAGIQINASSIMIGNSGSASYLKIDAPVILGTDVTFTHGSGVSHIIFNGVISGPYSLTITTSVDIIDLNAANTFGTTGKNITLTTGVLNINNASALGNSANTLVLSGGTINNTSGGTITLANPYVQTWSGNFAFTGTNNLNLSTGAVTLSADRTVTVNGGTLTVGGVVTGTGTIGLTKAGSGILSLTDTLTIGGNLTISAGTILANASAINVGGNWANSGTFTAGAGTVTFTATSGTNNITAGGSSFYNLTINGSGGTFACQDNLTVANNFTITAGIFTAPSGTLYVGGNWSDTGGAFKHNNGTVDFNGSGTQTIAYGNTFYNLTHSGGGTLQLLTADPSSWYVTSGWLYRKAITISNSVVSGGSDLSDFPLLISLASDAGLAAYALSTGYDILFTSSNGTTKLSHEIEQYTPGTGELVAWVKIPTLSASDDTILYMYYGNASADNQQDAANVWHGDYDYSAVWHLADATTTTISDSTGHGYTGTKRAVGEPVEIAGKIGNAQNFDGTNDYINLTGFTSAGTTYTFEFWINANNTSTINQYMFDIQTGRLLCGWVKDVTGKIGVYDGAWKEFGNTPSAGSWHQLAFVFNGSTSKMTLYVDGSPYGSELSYTPRSIGGNVVLGSRYSMDQTYFKGIIDEVRVSPIVRTAGWIATEWNNQNTPATYQAVGGQGTQGLTVANNLDNSGGTLDLNGNNVAVTGAFTNSNATLKLTGDENVTTPTLNTGSIVEYSATSGSRAIKPWTYTNATLKINGNNGTFTLPATKTVAGVEIADGTFDMNGFDLNVTGNWTKNGGIFTPDVGIVNFNGSITQSIGGSSATTFGSVTINNASGVGLTNDAIIGGTLTLTSGAFSVGSNTLTLNGPAIAGTPANLSATLSSSLIFGGSSAGVGIPSSVTALNNLTINNTNNVILNSNLALSGLLTLTSGALKITATAVGNDKIYDGNMDATVSLSSYKITSRVPTFAYAASFADQDVNNPASPITISVGSISLTGDYADDYVLSSDTASTTANIEKRTFTAALTGTVSKIYDGDNTATLADGNYTFTNLVGTERPTMTKLTGTYSLGADVGTGLTVTTDLIAGNFTDGDGFKATNYTLPTTASYTSGAITKHHADISGEREYDGTTNVLSSVFNVTGLVSGEALTLTGMGTITNKDVGDNKDVTVGSLALADGTGGKATNYTLITGTKTANITARATTALGITAENKVYDGTTDATINITGASIERMIAGDNLSLIESSGFSAKFADANVGTGKTIEILGLALNGGDKGNYAFSQPTYVTANITGKPTPEPRGQNIPMQALDQLYLNPFLSTGSMGGMMMMTPGGGVIMVAAPTVSAPAMPAPYTPVPTMVAPILPMQSFVEVRMMIAMPAIARVDTFTKVEMLTVMPMSANFAGMYVIQTFSVLVTPDRFRNAIAAAELPGPAGFAGTMATLSSTRIIRPDAFDGAHANFIQ